MKIKELLTFLENYLKTNQFSSNKETLKTLSKDESFIKPVMPSIVVYPKSSEEIQAIVQKAYELSFPITARGAGTSLEGNSIPEENGLVVDLSKMNSIIKIKENDLSVTVQPGIIYNDLNKALSKYGLFFPPSPGGSSDSASIGGMVSTNASGIYSVKYGATRDYIIKLKIITGKGELISIGSYSKKNSSAYNLVGLISGSEGTLAIISEITLKLIGIPPQSKKLCYRFPEEKKAAEAISTMMKYALDIAAIEYIDKECIKALNKLKDYKLSENAHIFIEIQNSNINAINETQNYIEDIIKDFEGETIELINKQNPWTIRHYTTESIKLRKKNAFIIRNDVAFPISKLPNVVNKARNIAKENGLIIHSFGHAGLGILHFLTLADNESPVEKDKAKNVNKQIISYVISIGGSSSGEHGIGLGLKEFMHKEHKNSISYMKEIKKVFDPKNILNPSKIFPE